VTIKRTLIIAEAGVNHNGDLTIAKKLIDAAFGAGADLVKFQTFDAERLATKSAPMAHYQIKTTNMVDTQLDMLKKIQLSSDMHNQLISYCTFVGIGFFSSAFDIPGLNFLRLKGANLFKIPSGEITNLPYLRHVGSFGGSIIISTGMSTLGEIEAALEALVVAGTSRKNITVLHCNTEYPTPFLDVNLNVMSTIRKAFDVEIGYSDHTIGIEVPIAAVALGAKVIEKHITINRELPGPDHKTSLEPQEFKDMVLAIRNIENALGSDVKKPTSSEVKNILIVRKSLVAARPISKGEAFTPDNVAIKRPGYGISPMRWDEVMGHISKRSFQVDEFIEL
jgi:N,N'-diacetyllegionaminate synthase